MKATVVIPTYNRAPRLRGLLTCLAHDTGEHLARVVVCDDGSSDDTRAVAESFRTRLPLVYAHQEDRGFRAGQARNLGIRAALGEVIVFLDDDVRFSPGFLREHLAVHEASADERIVIGYRHRAFELPDEVPSDAIIRAGEPDDRVAHLGEDGTPVVTHPTPWVYVYSCNFSVRRTPDLVYDEWFHGWGMEDIEMGYRLWRAGRQVVAAPKARVIHVEDPAPRDPFRCEERALPPKYDSYIRNSVYFMDKYPDDAALREWVRNDLRWYVRDEQRNCWVKNGYENDPDAVIEHCRRERTHKKTAALSAEGAAE